jgi:hypothetical protein
MIKDRSGTIGVPKQTYLERRLDEIQNKLRKIK